jgi:hypothetical protein
MYEFHTIIYVLYKWCFGQISYEKHQDLKHLDTEIQIFALAVLDAVQEYSNITRKAIAWTLYPTSTMKQTLNYRPRLYMKRKAFQ